MLSIFRAAFVAALLVAVFAPGAGAQEQPARCSVIPDTVLGPTDWQIRERQELREKIAAAFTAHGAPAQGLLFVDVDTLRAGTVRFLDVDLADSTIAAATEVVAEYLRALERGRAYQALIRVDGEYPAVLPGRTRCNPMLENPDVMMEALNAVSERHPLWGKVNRTLVKHADVLLVVNREGRVSWVQVLQPTGDEHLDSYITGVATRLRFKAVTLDGTPIDSRLRFRLSFQIR
jgi:TonB family protein